MNLNPRGWFAGRKSNDIGSSALVRAGMAMGPWQPWINGFVPREVNPWFYEALRSAVGVLDGAINRLVTVDGIIDVEGGNDALVQLIQRELIGNIQVGDLQGGLQAFYAGQGNELYEQGFTVGELVYDRRGRELVGLRVADSKGVLFHRNLDSGQLETWYLPPIPNRYGRRDGTDAVETVLRNNGRQLNVSVIQGKGYTLLNPATLVYSAFNPENDMPYGVSLMRGIEFVSQILLKMHNATGQAWDRFGDPVFHVNYKTKNRQLKDATLESRRSKLAADLSAAINAKRLGNSADFVTAVGADDDITVNIVGGDGKVLAIEMPSRHMLEQILAKAGLPAWMLGMQFSTAERMADNQAEVVLQESRTRFEAREHGLNRVVETWLRGRGKTWKPGDWQLVQRLPNLRDELKRAQAAFLNAQTQLMLANGGKPPAGGPSQDNPQGDLPRDNPGDVPAKALEIAVDMFDDPVVRGALLGALRRKGTSECTHQKGAKETWAIDDPELPRIAKAATDALGSAWNKLEEDTFKALQLPTGKGAGDLFVFDAATMLQKLLNLQQAFILAQAGADSEFAKQALEAWVRGIANTTSEEDRAAEADGIVQRARARAATALQPELQQSLQKTTVRTYENDIVKAISDGLYDGQSSSRVGGALRKKFAGHDYDWQRLADSEMAVAHAKGQLDALKDMGIHRYDFVAADDACTICKQVHDDGPYVVGSGPLPVRDTHPGCFCVVSGRVD